MLLEPSFLIQKTRAFTGHRKDLKSKLLFAIVLLIGAALRSYQLGNESYWIDEWATVTEGQQSVIQLLQSGRLDQPPAYYLPFHLWIQVFGVTEVSTRSFSILAGMGSIVLMYLIGRELFSAEAGLLGAFLIAISEFQLIYSQQARYYTFYECTTLLSFLFFIHALKSKEKVHFTLYVITTVLMIYSHAYGVFILAAQNLYFLLRRKRFENRIAVWLMGQALILAAIIPYFLPLFWGGGVLDVATSNTVVTAPPSLWQPLNSVYHFLMPPRFEQSWGTMSATYLVAAAFLGGSTLFYALRQGQHKWRISVREWYFTFKEQANNKDQLLLLSCWLVCPLLLPFILSWVVIPIFFNHRYNIGAAPAVYLLLASGILSARKVVPLLVSLSALLILIVPGLHYYYATDINQQWREAAAYIGGNLNVSDVVVFPPYAEPSGIEMKRNITKWYLRDDFQACGLDVELPDSEVLDHLIKCVDGHPRFWVIAFTDDPKIGRIRSFFLDPRQTTMHLLKEQRFIEISVYLFEWTE